MLKRFFFLLMFFYLFNTILAQQVGPLCTLNSISNSTTIPHTGTLKVLVVLCKFSDDTFDLSPFTDLWPHTLNSMPSWGSNLISSTVQSTYSNPSISGYYKLMSNGLYDVIGDVVFYQPQHNQNYYSIVSGKHLGYLTEEILTAIDQAPYNINFADYDNNSDGYVDMIQICFRFANIYDLDGDGYQGIAGLTGHRGTFGSGTTLFLDGKFISAAKLGSGTFQSGVTDLHGGLPVILHEFGHYLFGESFAGESHLKGIRHFGLMDSGGGSSLMNAYERDILGWIDPVDIESETLDISLTDAFNNGNIYKIKILNSNPVQYYYLEKRQGSNYYENSWKSYNGGPLMSPGAGLLISKTLNPQTSGRALDIECADGKWDWKRSDQVFIYPFAKIKTNRYNGSDELDLFKVPTTNGEQSHPNSLGDSHDFFNIGYNQIFSAKSNPLTNLNITIELISNINETMHINIFYSVSQPTYLQIAPSKPQNLKSVWYSNHPKITWEANVEADISFYKIYKMIEGETGWGHVKTVSHFPAAPSYEWIDIYVNPGGKWDPQYNIHYKISAVDNTDKESIYSDESTIYGSTYYLWKQNNSDVNQTQVKENSLQQNYPNPFNPSTLISYQIPANSLVTLKVFDILGNEVAILVNEWQDAGSYNAQFTTSGKRLASGMYFYTLTAGKFTDTKKLILMK
jgi:M6 family metalloprotease-like protein